MKTTKEALIETADLFETKGWCRGAYAQDKDGVLVSEFSEKADSFCLSGAMRRIVNDHILIQDMTCEIVRYLQSKEKYFHNIVEYNDYKATSKADIIAVLKGAAETL